MIYKPFLTALYKLRMLKNGFRYGPVVKITKIIKIIK